MNRVLYYLCFLMCAASLVCGENPFEATQDLPVACRGRFCSLESHARMWLYDFYHKQELKKDDLRAFGTEDRSALNLLWEVHFRGHHPWDDAPLFWIHYAKQKSLLGLDTSKDRFSFNALKNKSLDDEQLSQQLLSFVTYQGALAIENDAYTQMLGQMEIEGISSKEIAQALEQRFPLSARLKGAGSTLLMLPLRTLRGEWVSLHAFETKIYDQDAQRLVLISNFTAFTDTDYLRLRDAYLVLQNAVLSHQPIADAALNFSTVYSEAYARLADRPYRQAEGKTLSYPSLWRLKAETLYYKLPLIGTAIVAYGLALIAMAATRRLNGWTWIFIGTGLAVHTIVLAARCYILQRPPVSNMFETVVYVPWIALMTGIIFFFISRSRMILAAATAASLALLVLLQLTQVDARMENVQAVLDSQYWLIIHVLMVVGSYGAFLVSGILGHFYLINACLNQKQNPSHIAQGILHTMYLGVALLIPGTILGGVWAAESWGRFWDWDPKESWAFITACVYLLVIHAYTFQRIRDFGLAVGAVAGMLAVSFTWYGVNYVLGTGLHSYGFGSGGELYYYLYLAAEIVFLVIVTTMSTIQAKKLLLK